MKYLIMAAIIGGTSLTMWLAIHFGGKWIDKMLCVQPPYDPNKPLVRPYPPESNGIREGK